MIKKFTRNLLIGLSAIVLLVGAQQGLFAAGVNGINFASAQECINPPCFPAPPPPPPPLPSPECVWNPGTENVCGDTVAGGQANHVCTYESNSCDGSTRAKECWLEAGVCGYNPAPSCTPNEVIGTTQHCVGNQMCTFNIHRREDCSTYEGGSYGCQNSTQCGYNQPSQPSQPSQPNNNDEDEEEEEQGNAGLCQSCNSDNDCAAPAGESRGFCCTGDSCGAVKNRCTVKNWTVNDCSAPITPPAPPAPPIPPTPPTPPTPPQGNVTVNTPPVTVITGSVTSQSNPVITVNTPAATSTREIVREVQVASGNVGVGATAVAGVTVTQLPKTGLPALAWAAAAFLPLGFRMRRFSKIKKDLEDNPSYIWEDRQFKSES